MMLGCGQQYRPVVSAISPVGPASQPTKYAIAVSSPSPTTAGLLSVVDVSGDTILATPQIVPIEDPTNPNLFSITTGGGQGFVVNQQDSLSDVPLGSPTTLLTSNVVQTALPASTSCSGAPAQCASSVSSFTFGAAARILVPEVGLASVAVLSTSSPALQQLIGVAPNPVYVVGVDSTPRAYAISTGSTTSTTAGEVDAIEATSLSVTARIPVGVNPVYGVETTDARRAFILNKGSGTVSVINVTNNALDVANPTLPATGTLGTNPVWADLVTATNVLVVLNAGDGVHPGTLSIINIPLCSAAAVATNPACDVNNPVDATSFGTVVATVPVGVNPTMVSALADGSRAYVVNAGSSANGVEGSVSVVNLTSGTVTATIPGVSATATANPTSSPNAVLGHPNTIAATTGTPTGKVYVTASDSRYMTVIETDTDAVDTHVNLQGLGVRVRVSTP